MAEFKSYAEKLKDPRWQRMRLEILQRDQFMCRACGASDKTLHVHHCHYVRGDPWDTDPVFIITVCETCHSRRQAYEDAIRETIGRLCAEGGGAMVENLLTATGDALKIFRAGEIPIFTARVQSEAQTEGVEA